MRRESDCALSPHVRFGPEQARGKPEVDEAVPVDGARAVGGFHSLCGHGHNGAVAGFVEQGDIGAEVVGGAGQEAADGEAVRVAVGTEFALEVAYGGRTIIVYKCRGLQPATSLGRSLNNGGRGEVPAVSLSIFTIGGNCYEKSALGLHRLR